MNKTLYYVALAINETYKVPIDKAINIINNSFLPEILKEMPDYVQHYDAEYWAEEIMKDFVNFIENFTESK